MEESKKDPPDIELKESGKSPTTPSFKVDMAISALPMEDEEICDVDSVPTWFTPKRWDLRTFYRVGVNKLSIVRVFQMASGVLVFGWVFFGF